MKLYDLVKDVHVLLGGNGLRKVAKWIDDNFKNIPEGGVDFEHIGGDSEEVKELQKQVTSNTEAIKGIAATGGASVASAVIFNDGQNAEQKVGYLRQDLTKLDGKINGSSLDIQLTNIPQSSQTECHLDAGRTYVISVDRNVTLSTRYTSSGANVETIGTGQFTANVPRTFIPNYTTDWLRIGSASGSVNITIHSDGEIGLSKRVEKLEGRPIGSDNSALTYGYKDNVNALELWERGAINTSGVNLNSGTDAQMNIRTKTFIPSNVRFVECPNTYRLDVFQYDANGAFEKVYNLANRPFALLNIDKQYKLQMKPLYGYTDTIPMEKYSLTVMLTPFSMFEKPIEWGNVPFGAYYRGKQNDYSMFDYTSHYVDVITAFDNLVSASSGYLVGTDLGRSSDNQMLRMYELKPLNIAAEFENYGTTPGDGASSQGASCDRYRYTPTVFIVGGQHGFEKSSAFGLYYFVKDLIENWSEDSVLRYIRTNVRLLIVPILNTWGYDNNSYVNGNGVNLNRNWWSPKWTKYTGSVAVEATGDAPFDQPETALCRDVLLANPETFLVIDYHTAGSDSVPNMRSLNWCQLYEYGDPYYNKFVDACTSHMRDITINFNKDYQLNYPSTQAAGHITWENGDIGRLFQYACRKNFIGVTFEGFNGFYGKTSYTPDVKKANSELIGNFIVNVIRKYSR